MRRVVDRVKVLLTLTLPCQETNPDGVICGCVIVGLGFCVCGVEILWGYMWA